MRAIMARLRGPRVTPGARVDAVLAPRCSLEDCADTQPHYHRGDDELVRFHYDQEMFVPGIHPLPRLAMSYTDALLEARQMCRNLGLDLAPGSEVLDMAVDGLVRHVYAQGWLACESRLAAPNMADAIDLALTTPAAIVEQLSGESLHRWTIRAVQNIVAHGATSERKTAV